MTDELSDLPSDFETLTAVEPYEDFERNAHRYFDAHPADPEAQSTFFTYFTPSWRALIANRQWDDAVGVWERPIAAATSWGESRANALRVHLGTPLYFRGGTQVLARRFELGFADLHRAREEDKRAAKGSDDWKAWPANLFVTLSPSAAQHWKEVVDAARAFLEQRLEHFRKGTGLNLSIEDFRRKLLEDEGRQEAGFLLVYSLALEHDRQLLAKNGEAGVLGNVLYGRRLLNYYVVLETLLTVEFGSNARRLAGQTGAFYTSHFGGASADPWKGSWFQSVHHAMEQDPEAIRTVLDGSFDSSTRSRIEHVFALAAPLRNATAHSADPPAFVVDSYEEAAQLALDAIFAVVAKLP